MESTLLLLAMGHAHGAPERPMSLRFDTSRLLATQAQARTERVVSAGPNGPAQRMPGRRSPPVAEPTAAGQPIDGRSYFFFESPRNFKKEHIDMSQYYDILIYRGDIACLNPAPFRTASVRSD
jgi:hypothetical protein